MKKYLAEMIGTMVLVLMGCGAAVSLGCDPVNNQAAVVGTAMAFGLSVVAMAYAIGGISGCHIKPSNYARCILERSYECKGLCYVHVVPVYWWLDWRSFVVPSCNQRR